MKTKKRDIDPPKVATKKKEYDYPVYDGRGGNYPSATKDSRGYYRPVYLRPTQAPKEAQRLKLDTRLTNAARTTVAPSASTKFLNDFDSFD